ncbi:helix-turn-helix domain-containing protein [Halorubellus salinus]|uniref:helix-turn-helix domain-containing protein n=1 Tax=Halorubellus salinus TaxID=755309 RepID=UPI001D06D387|nr:helix-turn-helix domain-containing protein [Halorubellus salinus]
MTTVATFRLAPGQLHLDGIFEVAPSATVEFERVVPTHDYVVQYFWVTDIDEEQVVAVADDERVDAEVVDHVNDAYLLRVQWNRDSASALVGSLMDWAVTLLSAVGTCDGWAFEVRSDTHEELSGFLGELAASDVAMELTNIHRLLPSSDEGYGMTDAQREAIVLAYEHGYFETPHETSLAAIASELGITHQSLSSRLQRGLQHLVEETLVEE